MSQQSSQMPDIPQANNKTKNKRDKPFELWIKGDFLLLKNPAIWRLGRYRSENEREQAKKHFSHSWFKKILERGEAEFYYEKPKADS